MRNLFIRNLALSYTSERHNIDSLRYAVTLQQNAHVCIQLKNSYYCNEYYIYSLTILCSY
jgi:hypothetical protein